jgi:AraC-like DNA-binding protein
MSSVDHDHVRILHVHDKGGIAMKGAVHDDALVAVFPWGDRIEVNGARSDAPRLMVLGPGTELHTKQPGEYRYLRIGLRGPAFQALRNDSGKRRTLPWWTGPGVHAPQCSAAAERKLQELMLRASALTDVAARTGIDFRSALAVTTEEARVELAAVLLEADEKPPDTSLPRRRQLVQSAIDLLDSSPQEPASVSSVCAVLGVNERALQRSFQECVGVGLRAYERERRLRAVHGAILAEGNRRSITEIAVYYGFWHLGRFSAAYSALYGCTPSETREHVWRELAGVDFMKESHSVSHVRLSAAAK